MGAAGTRVPPFFRARGRGGVPGFDGPDQVG